jgi:photosystem II stability/assembly factor-like uncharacterized protein
MPLTARANQTFDPRIRRTAVSALTVLAVAGSAAGCAAASSGSPAAGSTRPAGTTSASAGPGSTPGSTGSPGAASSASCAANGATATAPPGSGSGSAEGQAAPALAAVQFTDSGHGWVAGAGRIMATSDGGASWTRQYAGPADLDQVDFIDGEHGWAAGGGSLLRTTDGGASWTTLAEPCQGELSSVHFVSPAVGYAVAAKGSAQTAGQPSPGGQDTTALGGSLLRTSNGGATWSPVTSAPADPQSACFGTADDGYLGTPAHIWRTTDGGQHWTLALTEPGAAGHPKTADTPEIECAGASGLWVLFLGQGAAMEHEPYLAYSTADGRQWRGVLEQQYTESALRPGVKLPEGPGSYPGPFSAIDPGSAAFVGYTPPIGDGVAPVMLASQHGSALTSEGNVGTINEPLAAAFLSPDQGWVVGENLRTNTFAVEATSNAGRTWTTEYTVG